LSQDGSRKVVIAALAGNVAIMTCKFVAAYFSRSTATLAEAIHSMADTGNEALLLVGMALAARPATVRFPFGRASERYFWPFIVALMLLSMGARLQSGRGDAHSDARPVATGLADVELRRARALVPVRELEYPCRLSRVPRDDGWQAVARGAPRDARPNGAARAGRGRDGPRWARRGAGRDPSVAGDGVAWLDPLGSVLIGLLLAAVAVVLASVTHGLLIGESATAEDRAKVLELAHATPRVVRVTQLLTMHLGPDDVLLALKVAFDPTMTVQDVEDTTNELERRVRKELPR